jgi:hypothetical protein
VSAAVARWLQGIDPHIRVLWAVRILLVTLVAWPLSSLTIFAGASGVEQAILGLSWLALILTCVDIVCTTDVRDTAP